MTAKLMMRRGRVLAWLARMGYSTRAAKRLLADGTIPVVKSDLASMSKRRYYSREAVLRALALSEEERAAALAIDLDA